MPASQPPASTWSWEGPQRPAPRLEPTAFSRLWHAFLGARIAIAVVLLLLLAGLSALGAAPGTGGWELGLCAAYFAAAAAARLLLRPAPPGRSFDRQWVPVIGVDLLAFSTLHFLQTANLNFSPLFALPVLTASVLGSALLALATAAAVTLLLLADAWVHALQLPVDYGPRFAQAGLAGGGYFAVALLANQLAGRLAREEQAALRSEAAARTQASVNELVIETLHEGVLVVSADCRIHAANPAARSLLGWRPKEAPDSLLLSSRPGWRPLAQLAVQTFAQETALATEVALDLAPGERLAARVRTRLTAADGLEAAGLCVMFLEDLREAEARVRTEKLAAMGRMSAAVAHEIRNPLAAIAQANALLAEDLQTAPQRQLSALVDTNAQRLRQIVDEILDLARTQQDPGTEWLPLDGAVQHTVAEWQAQTGAGERVRWLPQAAGIQAGFQPEHLRRVVVNLLDNAARYASQAPGAIQVRTLGGPTGAHLQVWSDGGPIPSEVQPHLFEPFFSSESRSSGLGLYICRELCQRHGANMGYRRAAAPDGSGRAGNDFFVQLRARPAPAL